MKIIAKYIHGSADSLDIDTYYVVDLVPDFQEAKSFCDSIEDENANLISIKDGVVTNCYKGGPDECNNSLLDTYSLHKQDYPLLIDRRLERDIYLKFIRAIRIVLSHLSRSQYRDIVKEALRQNMSYRLSALKNIDLENVEFCGKYAARTKDIYKIIAFQIGQTTGLTYGKEFYTKSDVANEFSSLRPYLYRVENPDLFFLNAYKNLLVEKIQTYIQSETDDAVMFKNGVSYNIRLETKI